MKLLINLPPLKQLKNDKENYILKIFLTKHNNNVFENYISSNRQIKLFNKLNDEMFLDGLYYNGNFREVGEWLLLIKNANYIITDSFHATVFSIIFKKEFLSVVNFNGLDRIKSLLSSLGISEDRILKSVDEMFILEKQLSKINYDKVDEKLDFYRNKSFNFLKSALEIIPNHKSDIIQI